MSIAISGANIVPITQATPRNQGMPGKRERNTPCTPVERENPSLRSGDDYDHHNDYNYNYTGGRARARETVCSDPLVLTAGQAAAHDITQAFEDVFCRHMPPMVAKEIARYIEYRGAEPEMICEVLLYTAAAERPSWAYARHVILYNIESGLLTQQAFLESLQRERARRAEARYRSSYEGGQSLRDLL